MIFLVMSPHSLVTVCRSVWVEPQTRGCPCLGYRKLVPSSCTSCGWFWWLPNLCLSKWHNFWRLTLISESTTFSLDAFELDEVPLWLVLLSLSWSPVLLEASPTVPSSGSVVALIGLEGGLVGSCPCGSELGLTSNANAGMFSSPCVELFTPSLDLLGVNMGPFVMMIADWATGRAVCFFCVGLAMNPANGHPTRGVPTKGISGKAGTGRGGVSVWWAGLSEGSGACEPSSSGTVMVAGMSSSCCVAVASAPLM